MSDVSEAVLSLHQPQKTTDSSHKSSRITNNCLTTESWVYFILQFGHDKVSRKLMNKKGTQERKVKPKKELYRQKQTDRG